MTDPSKPSPLRSVLRDMGRAATEAVENGQEARKLTLLALGPPMTGVVLSVVCMALPRGLREPSSADFHVTIGMGTVSVLVLAGLLFRSGQVRRGKATSYPRLWRFVPFTTLGGFVFGLVLALYHRLYG